MFRRANVFPAMAMALSLAACSEAQPLATAESTDVGTAGTSYTILDPELNKFQASIDAAIEAIYDRGLCKRVLTVRDLKKHPDLEVVPERGRASGRGFPGGDLYIASDIVPAAEGISVKHLAAHETNHACVARVRTMSEEITAPRSDLRVRYVRGFYLNSHPDPQQPGALGTGSLDEAAVEWMTNQVVSERSSAVSGYAGITQLFGAIAAKRALTVETVSMQHAESDITGIVESLTGETPTADRIGCVVLEFVKVQQGVTDPVLAEKAVAKC